MISRAIDSTHVKHVFALITTQQYFANRLGAVIISTGKAEKTKQQPHLLRFLADNHESVLSRYTLIHFRARSRRSQVRRCLKYE